MEPIKKFQTNKSTMGKWVEKTTKSEISLCSCGKKYIKTRAGQTICLPCIFKAKAAASKR